MRIVIWLAGASVAVREVGVGLGRGLAANGASVYVYDTPTELEVAAIALKAWHERAAAQGYTGPSPTLTSACYMASRGIYDTVIRRQAAWVLVIAGLYQPQDYVVGLRRIGVPVCAVLTESPYALDLELRLAARCDAAIVMERTAVAPVRTVVSQVAYVGHGWDPTVHHPVPADDDAEVPAHEALCIGTGFAERVPWMAAVQAAGVDLALYGTWPHIDTTSPLAAAVRGGEVPNARTAAYYRRARCVLNVHRRSMEVTPSAQVPRAESINPRVYEVAACGTLPITDPRAEMWDHREAWTIAQTPEEMAQLARRAVQDPVWRADRIAAAQAAIQPARWDRRAAIVLEYLAAWRAQPMNEEGV